MASSDATQRAVLAGLSCGIGLAAPVVMYAATLPFSSVNETVVAGAVPFAVGAVAGVGIYAASLGISEYRAQREERLFQPDAMGGAANLNQHQSEFKTASIPAQQQDAIPYAAASASQAQSEQSTSAFLSGLTGAFQRRHADDGVPTIARAADAMDEAEAWSMIDSMLDDDSPVSCDPARSRDVYQVAIDELTNGGQTALNCGVARDIKSTFMALMPHFENCFNASSSFSSSRTHVHHKTRPTFLDLPYAESSSISISRESFMISDKSYHPSSSTTYSSPFDAAKSIKYL